MAYCDFVSKFDSNQIKTIIKSGSRDLIDAVYDFEFNPNFLIDCNMVMSIFVHLIYTGVTVCVCYLY